MGGEKWHKYFQKYPEPSEELSQARVANLPVIGTGRFLEVILVLEEGQQLQYACEAFRWLDKLLRIEEDTREAPQETAMDSSHICMRVKHTGLKRSDARPAASIPTNKGTFALRW